MTFSAWVNKWIFQMAHVGWGAYLSLALSAIHPWIGFVSVTGFAAGKEFIFDPLTETPALSGGWKGDAVDFLFWIVGAGVGVITAKVIGL